MNKVQHTCYLIVKMQACINHKHEQLHGHGTKVS